MLMPPLHIKVTPRRILTEKEAAEYCGVSANKFRGICPVSPVQFPDGRKAYDMRSLDTWLDGLNGENAHSDDAILNRLG
jgi:hypothetical protein